jgi:hypothetical protein
MQTPGTTKADAKRSGKKHPWASESLGTNRNKAVETPDLGQCLRFWGSEIVKSSDITGQFDLWLNSRRRRGIAPDFPATMSNAI